MWPRYSKCGVCGVLGRMAKIMCFTEIILANGISTDRQRTEIFRIRASPATPITLIDPLGETCRIFRHAPLGFGC